MGVAVGLAAALFTGGAQAQSLIITPERDVYLPSETITVEYRFSDARGTKGIRIYSPMPMRWDDRVSFYHDPEYPREQLSGSWRIPLSELLYERQPEDSFLPIRFDMVEGDPPRLVDQRVIKIANPVQERNGAIRLPARTFSPRESVEIGVLLAPPVSHGLHATLALYEPPAQLANGTILEQQRGVRWATRFDEQGLHSATVEMPEAPGTYEIVLLDHNAFIVDRARVTVAIPVAELGLSLPADAQLTIGEDNRLDVSITAPSDRYVGYSLTPLILGPEDTWTDNGARAPWFAYDITQANRGADWEAIARDGLPFRPNSAGPHRILVQWQPQWTIYDAGPTRILLGQFDFDVAPETVESPEGQLWLDVGAPARWQGQPIEIGVMGQAYDGFADPLELRLYALPIGTDEPPQYSTPRPEPPTLSREVGSTPALVSLPEHLPPADYEAAIVGEHRLLGPRVLAVARFTVLPPQDSFALSINDEAKVVAHRPVTVQIDLPEQVTPRDSRLFVQLVHLGGELNDCHLMLESVQSVRRLEGETRVDFHHVALPGEWEARLYLGSGILPNHLSPWPDAKLLVADRFDVTYRPTPGALELMTDDPTNDEDIVVRVTVPPELGELVERGALRITTVRRAERALSGVERLPFAEGRWSSFSFVAGSLEEHALRLRPGPYEVRLTHPAFCFLGGCWDVVLDRLQFTVGRTDWFGILYGDTVDHVDWKEPVALALAPDEFDSLRLITPFPPLGPPGSCGDPFWLPPPEGVVELRLVRHVEGEYVPIETPLAYGDGFFVEARLEAQPRREVYGIRLANGVRLMGASGGDAQVIAVVPTEDDPKLLRSELHYVLWPVDEE